MRICPFVTKPGFVEKPGLLTKWGTASAGISVPLPGFSRRRERERMEREREKRRGEKGGIEQG